VYGQSLLSKVCDEQDVAALKRHAIEADHFATEAERKALRYVLEYAQQNGGKAPDGAFLEHFADGFYVPDCAMTFDSLSKNVKDDAFFREAQNLFTDSRFQRYLDEGDRNNFEKLLTETLQKITLGTSVRKSVGTSLKNDVDGFLDQYDKIEAGESRKVWRSKFGRINDTVGGYTSGNIYAWYGRSGRGKSVLVTEEAIESAMQGANVLFWSMEMSQYEVLTRMYTSLSGREGIVVNNIEGIDRESGFDNYKLQNGLLDDDTKAKLRNFLRELNGQMTGDIILRAVDDADFHTRTTRELESDIETVNADVVVIDPIYYMDFERNTSKTKGGDVAATSKQLRRLGGSTETAIHVITQADEVADETDEDGRRTEMRPPTRKELSKSKAILQDAALTLGIDTLDGQGIIQINKGRSGGEGTQIELTYAPQYGLVCELSPFPF
jgi:replicative DNA helicase